MNKQSYICHLQAIIRHTGWSQSELSRQLGVTFATINRWLNRHAVPHPSMQKAIYALYKEKVGLLPIPKSSINKTLREIDKIRNSIKDPKQLFKTKEGLREDLLLELTYNSNAIEGSTLTKKETEAVIFDKGRRQGAERHNV